MNSEPVSASKVKHVGMEPVSGEVTVIFSFADRQHAENFHAGLVSLMQDGSPLELRKLVLGKRDAPEKNPTAKEKK